MIIALSRYLLPIDKAVREGAWEMRDRFPAVELEGKTLGIVGAGRIGSRVAKKAFYGLDMKVIVYDPYVNEIKDVPKAQFVNDLELIFKESDFVTLHVPVTPETKGMVDRKYFDMMKPDAFLINAARGEIIDENELYNILKDKRIAGAAIDVFNPEPPIENSPLYSLDNIILTPHSAAMTREAMIRMAVGAAMGIDDVLSGRIPQWPFNDPRGK